MALLLMPYGLIPSKCSYWFFVTVIFIRRLLLINDDLIASESESRSPVFGFSCSIFLSCLSIVLLTDSEFVLRLPEKLFLVCFCLQRNSSLHK